MYTTGGIRCGTFRYLCFVVLGAFRSGAELFLHHERIVEVLGVVHRWVHHAVNRVVGSFVVHRTEPADLAKQASRRQDRDRTSDSDHRPG